MRKLAVVLAFSVVGCSTLPAGSETASKNITWTKTTFAEVQSICGRYWKQINGTEYTGPSLNGCAIWDNQFKCDIYTMNDLVEYSYKEQLILGHEVMHCFKKNYHPGPHLKVQPK